MHKCNKRRRMQSSTSTHNLVLTFLMQSPTNLDNASLEHCKNSGMTFIPKKVWFHFLHWAYQKRCDLHTKKGVIFTPKKVWSSYCLWYDLHTTFGMIFILLMVWSSYHFWYDLYTTFGMIFILLMVWSLYCFWYDIYTAYGMIFIPFMVWIFGIIVIPANNESCSAFVHKK